MWNYPKMEKIGSLEGHKSRVLYMTISPDGRDVASGAADENVYFWSVFPGKTNVRNDTLLTMTIDSR